MVVIAAETVFAAALTSDALFRVEVPMFSQKLPVYKMLTFATAADERRLLRLGRVLKLTAAANAIAISRNNRSPTREF